MKNFLFFFAFFIMAATAFAQKKLVEKSISSQGQISFNGKSCDALVARLVDPKDFQSVNLAGVSPDDMLKTSGAKPTGMDVSLKENADVMDMAMFFTYYKVPVENQEIIKVNGGILRIKENFLASKTMINKVSFGKDESGKSFTNIITVNSKKK